MKRLMTVCLATAALLVAIALPTQAQTGFGVRAGQISISSKDDIVTMDASTAFGAHVALGFLPIVDFMLGVEYLNGTADYDYGGVLDIDNQDFTSIGVFADIRKTFGLLPMFPVKLAVGGGMDYNLMTYLDEDAAQDYVDGGLTGNPDLVDYGKTGIHYMIGLEIKLPILPFTLNTEYRLQTINLGDDKKIRNNGLTLLVTFGF